MLEPLAGTWPRAVPPVREPLDRRTFTVACVAAALVSCGITLAILRAVG